MISRVAVLPQPPLLVPELMGAEPRSSQALRTACLDAVRRLAEMGRDWVALAGAQGAATFGPAARGSFAGYGVDVPVSLGGAYGVPESEPRQLPLPVLIAGWLREQAGASTVRVQLVAGDASDAQCGQAVRDLNSGTDEKALLVLGDGANRRGRRAPGGNDDRAAGFDSAVASALARADSTALRDLDTALAAELGVTGCAPWRTLGRFSQERGNWRAELLYSDAPFGVGYHVAVWDRR